MAKRAEVTIDLMLLLCFEQTTAIRNTANDFGLKIFNGR
jgi:hypothetical protein